jgi:hypothetical protein
MTRVLITAIALLFCVNLAAAATGDRCKVTDPTGTPLNVRSGPNGKITGTLANGALVSITDTRTMPTGSPGWMLRLQDEEGNRLGFPRVRLLLLTGAPAQQIPLASRRIIPILQPLRGRRFTARTRIEPTVLDDIPARP